jgi:DNA-binding response OmpR family regulator
VQIFDNLILLWISSSYYNNHHYSVVDGYKGHFMSQDSKIHVLTAVRLEAIARYRENLSTEAQFHVEMVPSVEKLEERLANNALRTDVLVLDEQLTDSFELIKKIRQSNPQLLIIKVDEEADFGMPGRADEVSTRPFENNELIKIIKRLFEDRRLETLRADSLPSVRTFAKTLLKSRGPAKTQAAVNAIKELGYDYVAFYTVTPTEPPTLTQAGQAGAADVLKIAPSKLDYETSIVGRVAATGESRLVGKEDNPNHPFISKGRFGAGVTVAVGTTLRFGVVFASREKAGSITPEDILMLELVCAQLASALARDQRR